MHKKLGPLEGWQWAAIAAALVLAYYLYEHEKNAAAANASSTTGSSTDTSGPIDPTTGLPYADEIGTGAGISGGGGSTGGGFTTGDNGSGSSTNGATSLQGELSDLGAIEQLMSGLGLGTGGTSTTTTTVGGLSTKQTNTLNTDLKTLNKTLSKQTAAVNKVLGRERKKKTKPADHKNPGHKITTHPDHRKTAVSTAPHNARQHHNVQPPNHQRATKRKPKPRIGGAH